ncbi:MAG: hypothetical protein LRZ96_00885 [Candidatus Pacebacteria bacterium]|nr:hypothetical protein [Candidatus Paceibacterota bacterium]
MRILTTEMVEDAINLARPIVEKILSRKDATWGPKWVEVVVDIGDRNFPLYFHFGTIVPWKEEWGAKKNFTEIALKKLKLSDRTGMNTSAIVALCPWQLEPGNFLYAGGVTKDGITVAVSGAIGIVDEGIASIIIEVIAMFAKLEAKQRMERGEMQI